MFWITTHILFRVYGEEDIHDTYLVLNFFYLLVILIIKLFDKNISYLFMIFLSYPYDINNTNMPVYYASTVEPRGKYHFNEFTMEI